MIEFTKMTGLGNDYIYINNINDKNKIVNIPAFTRYICNRHFGVGADGVILIKDSNIADFKMELTSKKELKIETLAGIRELKLEIEKGLVKEVTVNMGCARIGDTIDVTNVKGTVVSMGNPHFVVITEDVDKVEIAKEGPLIENNKIFPQKTNVEFIQVVGDRTIKMKVWERGSGETFACGTGACAAFAICNKLGMVKDEAQVQLKGGPLKIKKNCETQEIFMTGIATKICDGSIEDCTG